MIVETSINIHASKEAIWDAITDIENAAKMIRCIDQIEILEKPLRGIVGLKWRESRTMFGKKATEVMWITDAVPNESYHTRAESHGFVYVTKLRITSNINDCQLTMTFESTPQTLMARFLSIPMLFFRSAITKAIQKDLDDIKTTVESR
jgi:hypothetical protein